jgi:hypothetical protein
MWAPQLVIAELDPAIHVTLLGCMDARVKPAHDEAVRE